MSCLLANCSLVYRLLTHVLRVVCWTDQSSCTFDVLLRSASHLTTHEGLSVDTSVSRVFCFGLCGRLPPKLLEQSSALLLFCSGHRRVGHVPHGQWALLGTHMIVLIDRSACLVEPCTCARQTKCAPHGPLTVFRREAPIVRSLRRTVLAPALSLSRRDLDPASGRLVDCLVWVCSASTALNDVLCMSKHTFLAGSLLDPVLEAASSAGTFGISSSQWGLCLSSHLPAG